MNRRRVFQLVAIAAAVAAYLTIVVGGDVRSTGAGMACGESWPLCSGGIVPDLSQPKVAIEFAHRVVAFTTSILILAAFVLALLWFRREPRTLFLAFASLVLLVGQVVLGMVTVASLLDPTVVTAHLALGTATFAAALVLAVVSLTPPQFRPAGDGSPA